VRDSTEPTISNTDTKGSVKVAQRLGDLSSDSSASSATLNP